MHLLSQNYRDDYEKTKTGGECTDLYLRLLMVTDYISGMTDTYTRTLYRELIGVEYSKPVIFIKAVNDQGVVHGFYSDASLKKTHRQTPKRGCRCVFFR